MAEQSKNPNNYPDPQSPEGKARAGRLYFALLVILFIFLGTIIILHQFNNNIIKKINFVQYLPIGNQTATTETQEEGEPAAGQSEQGQEAVTGSEEEAQPSESAAPQETPATEANPAPETPSEE